MARRYRYLLGDSRREAARLAFQARLWDPFAESLFDRFGPRRGARALELGPGAGSLHRVLRRRAGRPVDAVERSPVFARALRAAWKEDGLGEGRLWESDLLDADLPRSAYDFVFVRWVFLFLPDPLEHLRRLARALRPGGTILVLDYHRETMGMAPRPPHWEEFVAADRAFFATQGGDASLGTRLPSLFARAGLATTAVVPEIKTGSPGSATWRWLSEYFLGVLPRYGRVPPLTPAKAARLGRAWRAAARRRESLLIAPAVLAVAGRKPR